MFSGRADANGRQHAKYKHSRRIVPESEAIVGMSCLELVRPGQNARRVGVWNKSMCVAQVV